MNKFFFTTLAAFVLTLCNYQSHAQLQELWSADLSGSLQWQTVTSSGSHIVATSNGLYSFDQESGKVLWENTNIKGFSENEVTEMSGSPLLVADKNGVITIINPFDGRIAFNSQEAGIATLTNKNFLYKANGILIAGKTSADEPKMLMVDIASGKTNWTINEKFGRIVAINEISASEIIVTTLFYVYKINAQNGSIIWKNSVSGASSAMADSPLGALMQGMVEEMAKDMDFVIRYYQDLEQGIFVVASEVKNETPSSSGGAPSVSFRNNYTAFKISDGSTVWSNPVDMKGKLGDLAFDKDGVIILPDDGGNTLINKYKFDSAATGMWGKNGKGIKVKGGIYSHVKTNGGLLLISKSGSNNFINFLDLSAGVLTYDKSVKISGEVVQTLVSDKGIAYITTEEVNIVNPITGDLLLAKPVNTTPTLTQLSGSTLYAFDNKRGVITTVNLATAEVKDITSEKLKFEGKESPNSLEVRSNGVLLLSEQNIAQFGMDGSLQFQKYYPAPKESGLRKALLYAQAARAAYISVNAYAASASLQAATPAAREQDAVTGAVVEAFGMAYEELGNQASDFAKKSFQQANARFKATTESRDFVVMLTEGGGEFSLVKVSKENGEATATVGLGKNKEPKYAVDDVTGRIFKKDSDSKIVCYQL